MKLPRASKPARSNNLCLWTNSIKNARLQIADLRQAHPGIKSKAPELFAKAWRLGRNDALGALRLDDLAIPDECPWTFEEVCAENFWPVPWA